MVLPADGHVHSEWSWDAPLGAMEQTCEQAVRLGLPAVAFTEHVDLTPWVMTPEELAGYEHLSVFMGADGLLTPPPLDVDGYLACVDRCRDRFPTLRIITGVELGQPHWHPEATRRLAGRFERVLGSLHGLKLGEHFAEATSHYRVRPAAEVLRDYLAEIPRLVEGSDVFGTLAHIDYAVRYWPASAAPFQPGDFQEEFRHALRALAGTGRALEVNTRLPLHPDILRWWRDEGGQAVTFGSDAHLPDLVGHGFAEAVAMVEAHGFRPGRRPYDVWARS